MAICKENAFTIESTGELPYNPTLKAPLFAIVDKPITCTGLTNQPNETVWIVDEEGVNEELARTTSDTTGKYSVEVTFSEFGQRKIHAEIEGSALNPLNRKSQTRSVFVIDWWILLLIAAVLAFTLWYFWKGGGAKKKAPVRRAAPRAAPAPAVIVVK